MTSIRNRPTSLPTIAPEFVKSDFENSVWDKGYRVRHKKTLKCPCKSKSSAALTTCQNCQGTGWFIIDAVETKMLASSINSTTKYKVWSEENMGTVSISANVIDKISFMDQIEFLDASTYISELLYTQFYNNQLFAYTVYNILSVKEVYMFVEDNQPLQKLIENVHFTIDRNKVIIIGGTEEDSLKLSIRYEYNVVYGVIDTPHDIRNSYIINSNGQEESIQMPVQAIGRRFHYLIDSKNFEGDNLFDNSTN